MIQNGPLKIKIQIYCHDEIAMGPGKADLLEAIGKEGSISAAGRALGMSYRRTWLLVDVMNRCWRAPLVETSAGGSHGGGARLSSLGTAILQGYRKLEQRCADAAQGTVLDGLLTELRPEPLPFRQERPDT
jgi:molybdate transport system regulatory protein